MKKLFFTLTFIFVFLFSFSQSGLRIAQNSNNQNVGNRLELAQANSENELENSINRPELNQSPFNAVRGKKEIPSKRDQYSKTYQNEDGSFTALIGAGPIHYDNNGVWEDFETKIIPNGSENFPYKNTTNLFSSYYGATAHKGIKSVTAEGEVLEFQNVKMAWEVNGQTVNNINAANSSATINNDIATYPHLFGNISAEFTSLVGKRELNYVIPNAQALSNAPENAEYLVFTEEINLPINWIATSTDRGIEVKDNTGEVIYLYPKPVSTDANVTLRQEENTIYEMHQNGSVLTLKTKVKTEWLLSEERVFPVKVDPTTKGYPDNITGWTKSVASDGYDYNDFQFGTDIGYWVRGFAKYNLESIPSAATVNSASSYIYIFQISGDTYFTNSFRIMNASDPVSGSGLSLFSSATSFYSPNELTNQTTGWMNVSINNSGLSDIENSFASTINLCVDAGGDWYNTCVYKIRNHIGGSDGSQKPYLLIDYTVSSGCSGTPTGGTASATPNSGTHNSSVTVSVSGSTSATGITYQWESATSSSGPWTTIIGATSSTYNFSAPYSNGTVYYRRKITCTNSSQSAYSSVASFTTTCTPSYTTGNMPGGGYGYIGITNVTIGTINNTTGYQNNSPAYNYYSNLSTDVEIGQSYTLYVTYKDDGSPYNPGKIGVWVDWNNDGDFSDANEFIGIESNVANNAQKSFTITVPNGTTSGTKRLRIRSAFNEETVTSSDACTVLEYGETEDYNLEVIAVAPLICSTLDNLTPSLDDPINGPDHHLRLDWDGLTGATSYDVQFSIDGINYTNATPSNVPNNYAQLNAGDYPNERYWFRVRAKSASETCDWTYSDPIYTACDNPRTPLLSNAVGNSLDLTIQPELPVANPSHTEYAIYCETTGQYVQADGSLGSNPVWQTNAQWGTMTVGGLTTSTNYCFYVMAKNGDGHIVGAPENSGNTLITQTFDSNVLTTNTSFSSWFAPDYNTPITWNNTEGCPSGGGAIGYSGIWNNNWGNFVRLPAQNFTGVDEAVMTFDLTNSFTAGQTNNNFRFYIHDGGSYQNPPTTVEIGGNTYTQQGINNFFYLFDVARTCEPVTVTYDISGIANKSSLMFYIEVNSGYNNSNPFFFYIDNLTLSEYVESSVPTECTTIQAAPVPTFHDYGSSVQLNFNNSKINQDKALFRLSHPGSTVATKYEIQVSPNHTFTGTPWSHVYNGSYASQTQTNFTFGETEGNLTNGTTYYVRARVDLGAGWGDWTTKTYSFTYTTETDVVEWFQTTTPQFVTGTLNNVESTIDEARQIVSGGGGSNVFSDPSFETGSGWSTSQSYSVYKTYLTTDANGTNGITNGSRCVKFAEDDDSWQSFVNGEYNNVSQQVDLTGVGELKFDITHWRNTQSTLYQCGVGRACKVVWSFKVIIGDAGTSNNNSGVEVYNWTPTTAEFGVTNNFDVTVDLTSYNFTGTKTVKFSRVVTNGGGVWYDDDKYYLDNIRSGSAPFGTGSITSPAIYKSSFPTTESNYYTELYWTQEIHSSLVMAMQRYDGGSSSWVDVAGYDNITFPTSGAKTYDISGMTAYDSIRIKATMEGSNQVKLFDWGVRLDKSTPLPVKLLNFNAICSDNKINFSWSTASETNSDFFEIFETADFKNFERIAKIPAAGFSSIITNYEYIAKAKSRKTYFQLRQHDFDGKMEILSNIFVDCTAEQDNEIYIYPNPNKGEEIIIASNSEIFEAIILIYDAAGRLVKEFIFKDFGIENKIIFKPKLEPGVYLLVVKNLEKEYKQFKFIVN